VVILAGRGSLARTVESLSLQSYRRWNAVVLASAGAEMDPAASDPRVRFVNRFDTAASINRVVEESEADFVLFVRPGDTLDKRCLMLLTREAHREPLLDLAYWDDAPCGAPRNRRFRPGWSPDTLLSANYIGNAFAIRRGRFLAAGGLRDGSDDAFLWDLLLRAALQPKNVTRLPLLLSHHEGSWEQVSDAGLRVVSEECLRRGWAATVDRTRSSARVHWEGAMPFASIIIPTRHNRAFLARVFDGLRRTRYDAFELIVIDNGPRTAENEAWYAAQEADVSVVWWTQPFNYSAVNNLGARHAQGDVLVFLNDDIEVVDPEWLRELVGWATADGVGAAGMQLIDTAGRIQHGGVVVGLGGFAGHLFQGMRPGADSPLGSTTWYRNVLAVTAACLAVRRTVFEEVGGFDERFILCGNDVALGLALHVRGLRNICSPLNGLRHLESATRGSDIPIEDFYASYWVYQPWLRGGDPYFSPALALDSGVPRARNELDVPALEMTSTIIGKSFGVFRSEGDLAMAGSFATRYNVSSRDVAAVHELHARSRDPNPPSTINWFIPGVDSPFYGGINTVFRIADHLSRLHGVHNRFVFSERAPSGLIRAGAAAGFPHLVESEAVAADSAFLIDTVPPADIAIATLWTTAYDVARYAGARRKFYLIQDFEPRFYPAGTVYALAEESYRLGLYGLCNTQHLADLYSDVYGGKAFAFTPAVDSSVFHAHRRREANPDEPVTIFVYARPGHWRNCWELAHPALVEVKRRLGDRVRVVAAGSWAIPEDSGPFPCVHQLGLLDYRATGELYRECDIGLALTVSEHPSYLPLELLACGVPVVAFDNPAGHWLLENEVNSLLTLRTVDGLADAMERLVINPPLRRRLAAAGLKRISERHSDWESALGGIYKYLTAPDSVDEASESPHTAALRA